MFLMLLAPFAGHFILLATMLTGDPSRGVRRLLLSDLALSIPTNPNYSSLAPPPQVITIQSTPAVSPTPLLEFRLPDAVVFMPLGGAGVVAGNDSESTPPLEPSFIIALFTFTTL